MSDTTPRQILGTQAANVLFGFAGADTIQGFDGADSLVGRDGNDVLEGGGFWDTLDGGDGDDVMSGGDDNDLLLGGQGRDTLRGDSGEDRVSYENNLTVGVVVSLLTGTGRFGLAEGDVLIGIENLTGSGLSDELTGSDDANRLFGGDGNDTLSGMGGNDLLGGGDGNDLLFGDEGNDTLLSSGGDTLRGGAGRDLLLKDAAVVTGGTIFNGGTDFDRVDYGFQQPALTEGIGASLVEGGFAGRALGDVFVGVEALFGAGGNDSLTGDRLANELQGSFGDDRLNGLGGSDTLGGGTGRDSLAGGAGDDRLFGGPDNDTLAGGAGNDRYEVSAGDRVIEFGNGGADTVFSSSNWTLGDHVEVLVLQTGAGNGIGNGLANRIEGNAAANLLNGAGGSDTLLGGLGADTLLGGAGRDLLDGGFGNDRLVGGAGRDTVTTVYGFDDVRLARIGTETLIMLDPTGADTLVGVEAISFADGLREIPPASVSFNENSVWAGRFTRLDGVLDGGRLGSAVGAAGDIDGDGFADLVFGMPEIGTVEPGGSEFTSVDGGAAWIVWGREGGFGARLAVDGTTAGGSTRLDGPVSTGLWVGGVGDTDGDGRDDIAIAVPEATDVGPIEVDGGSIVLLRGDDRAALTSLFDPAKDTVIQGPEVAGIIGARATAAGDFNGDGLADLAIAAGSFSPEVWVVLSGENRQIAIDLGQFAGPPEDGSVTHLTSSLLGLALPAAVAVSGGGDVNGDGFDDLLIGASEVNGSAGAAWLLRGGESGWGAERALGGAGFVTFVAPPGQSLLGSAVAIVGDVNADGFDDMLVTAPGANDLAGAAYLVLGRESLPGTINLETASGVARFDGTAPFGLFGMRAGAAGDMNGDGFDDFFVGLGGGAFHLILGRESFVGDQLLSLPGVIHFSGDSPAFGRSIAGVGDVDGDGLDDLLVGQSTAGDLRGAAYLIYGEHWLAV